MPLPQAVPDLSHEKCVWVQALLYLRDFLRTPLTILGGLAIGFPMLHRCPSLLSWVFGVSRQFHGTPSSLRSFAGLEDVLDESSGSDVEDELVPKFDDNPGTTTDSKTSVLQKSLSPRLVRCDF